MEEQEHSGNIDNPETVPPFPDSPVTDPYDETEKASRKSIKSEEKRPALAQRLAEAFREGVASTRPDYDKHPDVRITFRAKKDRQESSAEGILDRVIQEGGSAAAVVGDKAASALEGVVRMVKQAPALTHKYAEAFREGAASVKTRDGRERGGKLRPSAKKSSLPSDGRVFLDRMFRAGDSAAKNVRDVLSNLKPGEVRGAGQKIRMGRKKINNLYVEIGLETVNHWSSGPVETEKVAALLNELQKTEEEIRNLQEHIAEVAAARKREAARSLRAEEEAVGAPAPGEETPVIPPAPEYRVDAEEAPQEEATDEAADQALTEEPEAKREK